MTDSNDPRAANNAAAADETLARITELARQALQAQAALAKQSLELGRATLSGDVDRSSTSRAYLDAVSREGARYWREAGALGFDYASELMALGTRSAARIISDATTAGSGARSRRGPVGTHNGSPPPAPPPVADDAVRRASVLLRAAVGQTAQSSVTVVNHHPRARRVELEPSELRDATGTVVAVTLRVDPDRVTIPAGGEYQVRIEADLDQDIVQPGQQYVGSVVVSGGDEATLEVTVEVAD
ncbi:hypothetical protein BJ986_001146 [Phycicoccus badiiscoriae]|uniref:Uncharacterized protein n=1 Tax=Pedococcus badiiscoriae TaxID=642776 RepID=A0A852WCY9_9MICO|nr:hypothetical protein [Pedococcus badiiscoriae]NYG06659.1 hypothetical protein [Pedococcus badiiscoriae]